MKLIKILLIFSLLIQNTYAGIPITDEPRTKEIVKDFIFNGNPSDLPYINYMESFIPETYQPLEAFDLSKYSNKEIYVGYGIFDSDQKYCKYTEIPGLNPSVSSDVFSNNFSNIHIFNNHSYAKSIDKMDFSSCKVLVNKFGGYIATPTSFAENSFLRSYGKDGWLGIYRESCTKDYYNEMDLLQDFFNWSKFEDTEKCLPSNLKVKTNEYNKWLSTTASEQNYCLIEIDSPHATRPIKICAPWWRVEREYKKDLTESLRALSGGIDYQSINQADIPQNSVVCTKMEEKALTEDNKTRRVTYTTYYDAMKSDACLLDPIQEDCFVDEGRGFVTNACKQIEEITPFKDYTKVQIKDKDGNLKWIKGKDKIKTHVYDCPPTAPSLKSNCLETSVVLTYPKECPGSQCQEYKECMQSTKERVEQQKCATDFKCKKIYGSADLPKFDSNGNLVALLGYCKDDNGNYQSTLEFPININKKIDRKCVEHAKISINKTIIENCKEERTYKDYTIEMALSDQDIYDKNESCIRMNNIAEARPLQEMVLNYESMGYAKTIIKDIKLDGTGEVKVNHGNDGYLQSPSEILANYKRTQNLSIEVSENQSCDFLNEAFYTFFETITEHQQDPNYNFFALESFNPTYFRSKLSKAGLSDPSSYYMEEYADSSETSCSGTGKIFDPDTKICDVFTAIGSTNIPFKYIAGTNPTILKIKDLKNKKDCIDMGSCLEGFVNENDYSSDTELIQCIVSVSDDYDTPDEELTLEGVAEPKICKPTVSSGVLKTDLDGNRNIFTIQEVTDGDWGYYTNHTTWNMIDNRVTFKDKEIFPIKNISTIDDVLSYYGVFRQKSIKTKKPKFLSGLNDLEGAGVAIATGPVGLIAIGVSVFFGKSTKLNEQFSYWETFKIIKKNKYIPTVYDYRKAIEIPNLGIGIFNGEYIKLSYLKAGENPAPEGFEEVKDKVYKNFSGTLKPGDFKVNLANDYKQKQQIFMCAGWNKEVAPIMPIEKEIVQGYPKCKWWKRTCEAPKITDKNETRNITKRMNTYYRGATTSISIVVPYLSAYTVKAYDKYNNELGTAKVEIEDFENESVNKVANAQVMFGLNMDLAIGINDGTQNNACRYDLMTEWGGGVSGIYYENGFTGMYNNCQKSNDAYVKDHSAVKLKITPKNSDRSFDIKLEKPLPYPNRIFITTLGKKETREYRCFDEFKECGEDDFIKESE